MPRWTRFWAMGTAVYVTTVGLVILSNPAYQHRWNLQWLLGPPIAGLALCKLLLRDE